LSDIAETSQGTLGAAVFFGSRSSGVATNSASAYDLMLVCDRTDAFYRVMHQAGILRRSPALLGLLDSPLPPTQVRLTRGSWLVKASVVSMSALTRATSPARKDQFLAGRLFQDVHVVWTRDAAFASEVQAAVESARRVTLDWVAPDLPLRFSAADYVRQLFQTSFRFEIRPESRGRADSLYSAQADRLVPVFDSVLGALASEGRLIDNRDATFSLREPVSAGTAFRRRAFLEGSRIRATARWPKHAITFDGWLDYIVRKAERHSGETIVLTRLERRLPFIFLWPRALRFLARQRGRRRTV
jgi:hypothetical protein